MSDVVNGFEMQWKPESGGYSRKLVEYCALKVLDVMCTSIEEAIDDGSFSRFTFDMMLAWETPTSHDEQSRSVRFI